MQKTYTIGEIFRLGLLKNHEGKPYAHKSTVSKIVNKLSPEDKNTAFGNAKVLSEAQIHRYNSRWDSLSKNDLCE